jgi:hypothetical protein
MVNPHLVTNNMVVMVIVVISESRRDATEARGDNGRGQENFFHETSYRGGCGVKIVAGVSEQRS